MLSPKRGSAHPLAATPSVFSLPRALRLQAAEKDTTLNALAVEAFNDLLRKHGKRATVENPLLPDRD
jgi:hypothetical protein